jgi:hypothetical protein
MKRTIFCMETPLDDSGVFTSCRAALFPYACSVRLSRRQLVIDTYAIRARTMFQLLAFAFAKDEG